jgi:flagellar assembly protein FliH
VQPAAPASRIIAAEALAAVTPVDLAELAGAAAPLRSLSSRDLGNETARAAFALGRRRGYEQGVREGLEQGFASGSLELAQFQAQRSAEAVARSQPLVEGFRTGLARLESDLAADLVSLAIDIARQVLRREPAPDAQALLPAAREALRSVAEGASQLHLHVHPGDAAILAEHLEAVRSGHCKLRPDGALPAGSCRLEADTGIAEAGFAERWQAVMDTLGRSWESPP